MLRALPDAQWRQGAGGGGGETSIDEEVTPREWDESVRNLSGLGRYADALDALERAAAQARGAARFEQLLALHNDFPAAVRREGRGLSVRLRLLGNLPGGPALVLDEVEAALGGGLRGAFLNAYQAWALSQQEEDRRALAASERALTQLADLSPFEGQLLLRARGQSLARLGRPGWDEAFRLALERCSGRTRGITLMEWGGTLSRFGDQPQAMAAFAQAQGLLRGDPLEAWPLGSMALICLHAVQLRDAERYFREMAQVQRRSGAFLSRALSGQAAVRRVRGHWAAARHLYTQAEQAALDTADEDNLRQARRGRGHTWRLSGHPLSAVQDLTLAAQSVRQDRESGVSWVYADLAAALVTQPALDPAAVRSALAQTGPLGREDQDRATIVRAELARREGGLVEALALLRSLDRQPLWVREEAHAFTELFALLPAHQRPEPLRDAEQLTIRLRALGLPEVRVGAERTEVPPQALVVLAALLEGGGECSCDALTEALDDRRPRSARQARQRVSKAVAALRMALGWPQSVLSGRGHYRLSPDVNWHYDVAQAQAAGLPLDGALFLQGIDLPWVTEREQELSQKDADNLL